MVISARPLRHKRWGSPLASRTHCREDRHLSCSLKKEATSAGRTDHCFLPVCPVLAPGAVFIPGDAEDDVLQMVPRPVPEEEDILGVVQKE